MPSLPDTSSERLRATRAAWLETLRDLCGRTECQREAIAAPDGEAALRDILAEKEVLYRRADDLARQALALEAAGAEPDAAGAALKSLLQAALSELSDAEDRARKDLSLRVADLQTRLDGLRSGRAARGAYALTGRDAVPAPRFLDQTR